MFFLTARVKFNAKPKFFVGHGEICAVRQLTNVNGHKLRPNVILFPKYHKNHVFIVIWKIGRHSRVRHATLFKFDNTAPESWQRIQNLQCWRCAVSKHRCNHDDLHARPWNIAAATTLESPSSKIPLIITNLNLNKQHFKINCTKFKLKSAVLFVALTLAPVTRSIFWRVWHLDAIFTCIRHWIFVVLASHTMSATQLAI